MTAFDTAAACLFADANRSETGTLRPVAGGSIAVRLLFSRPDDPVELGETRLRNPGYRIDLWAEGLATPPVVGDEIDRDADGETYTLQDVQREALGGWFVCDVDVAS